ncbi:LuxR C-terminal-related transcriptional regulator [Nocardioides sp.]|uniref:helix-turn-helix transcriptional regulator n=1 Tax=Nocardioides sp. TaxID=35761 RepID=UPI003513F3EF
MRGTAPIGRDDVLQTLARHPAVLLVGERGLGLTAVLAAVADQRGAALLHGGEAVVGVPFVPATRLLADLDLADAEPLRVLTQAPPRLLAAGRGLVVDDADRLDDTTAVLLAQAARAGVPLVVGAPGPGGLPAALRDVVLTLPRVDLGPLPEPVANAVADARAEAVGGAPLDPPSRSALRRRVEGRPGLIVALLDAAFAEGAATPTPAGLHLTRLPVTPRVLGLLGVAADDVARHRPILQRLALAGPLPVAVVGPGLEAAVATGLVEEDGETARLRSPLLGDLVRPALSGARRRRIVREIADELAAHGGASGGEEGRPAVLRTVGGSGEAVAEAVAWLRSQDRREEALEVLDALPASRAEEATALLCRADVLADLGRVEEALRLLDRVADDGCPETTAAVIARWAEILGGEARDDDRLERRVREVGARLDAPRRAEVTALLARRRVIRGARQDDGHGDRWAALLRETLTGSLTGARRAAEAGAGRSVGTSPTAHLRTLVRFLSLVYDGEIVAAREIAEREFARADRTADPLLGLWSYNRTKIAVHAGQAAAAVRLGAQMCRHLAWRDPFGLAASGSALHASALARTGRSDRAHALLETLVEDDLLLPRARIGRARVLAQDAIEDGDPAAASAVLAEAGRFASEHDEAHSGLLALDEAFWVAPTARAAAALEAADGRSGLATAFAARARALLAGDADALAVVAADLERMIQPGRAAATWLAVERLHLPHDSAAAEHARRQAVRLQLAWGAHPWPLPFEDAVRLTPREREIAGQAAVRRSSRDIAHDLGLSARTVDNHLARVFRKLGLSAREELAEVLGLLVAADPAARGGVASGRGRTQSQQ